MGYDIVLADPPWQMYGDPNKMAAAGKHYNLISNDDLAKIPVKDIMNKKSAIFLWATCPRLPLALDLMQRWGFHYRGIAYIWVKTRKDGGIIGAQGIPPTFVKPTTELVLAGSTCKTGRPFPILTSKQAQVQLATRAGHSEKPKRFRELIVELCGDRPRIELFSRESAKVTDGWVNVGNAIDGQDINDAMKQVIDGTYV